MGDGFVERVWWRIGSNVFGGEREVERKSEKLSVYLRLKGTCGQLKLEDFDEVIKLAWNYKKKEEEEEGIYSYGYTVLRSINLQKI